MASIVRRSHAAWPLSLRHSCLMLAPRSSLLLSPSPNPTYPAPPQANRLFHSSTARNGTFDNLASLSQSRETGYYSKATRRPRTAFSSSLQLLKAEAEAVPGAVGFGDGAGRDKEKGTTSSTLSHMSATNAAAPTTESLGAVDSSAVAEVTETVMLAKELKETHKMLKTTQQAMMQSNHELRVSNQKMRNIDRRATGSLYERARALTFGVVMTSVGVIMCANILILIVAALLNNEVNDRLRVLEERVGMGTGQVERSVDEVLAERDAALANVKDKINEASDSLIDPKAPTVIFDEGTRKLSWRESLFWATAKTKQDH